MDFKMGLNSAVGDSAVGDSALIVGDRCLIVSIRRFGIIRFIGHVAPPSSSAPSHTLSTQEAKVYAGVELDEPGTGKNNGQVGGVVYFECSPMSGIFVPLAGVSKVQKEPKLQNHPNAILSYASSQPVSGIPSPGIASRSKSHLRTPSIASEEPTPLRLTNNTTIPVMSPRKPTSNIASPSPISKLQPTSSLRRLSNRQSNLPSPSTPVKTSVSRPNSSRIATPSSSRLSLPSRSSMPDLASNINKTPSKIYGGLFSGTTVSSTSGKIYSDDSLSNLSNQHTDRADSLEFENGLLKAQLEEMGKFTKSQHDVLVSNSLNEKETDLFLLEMEVRELQDAGRQALELHEIVVSDYSLTVGAMEISLNALTTERGALQIQAKIRSDQVQELIQKEKESQVMLSESIRLAEQLERSFAEKEANLHAKIAELERETTERDEDDNDRKGTENTEIRDLKKDVAELKAQNMELKVSEKQASVDKTRVWETAGELEKKNKDIGMKIIVEQKANGELRLFIRQLEDQNKELETRLSGLIEIEIKDGILEKEVIDLRKKQDQAYVLGREKDEIYALLATKTAELAMLVEDIEEAQNERIESDKLALQLNKTRMELVAQVEYLVSANEELAQTRTELSISLAALQITDRKKLEIVTSRLSNSEQAHSDLSRSHTSQIDTLDQMIASLRHGQELLTKENETLKQRDTQKIFKDKEDKSSFGNLLDAANSKTDSLSQLLDLRDTEQQAMETQISQLQAQINQPVQSSLKIELEQLTERFNSLEADNLDLQKMLEHKIMGEADLEDKLKQAETLNRALQQTNVPLNPSADKYCELCEKTGHDAVTCTSITFKSALYCQVCDCHDHATISCPNNDEVRIVLVQ